VPVEKLQVKLYYNSLDEADKNVSLEGISVFLKAKWSKLARILDQHNEFSTTQNANHKSYLASSRPMSARMLNSSVGASRFFIRHHPSSSNCINSGPTSAKHSDEKIAKAYFKKSTSDRDGIIEFDQVPLDTYELEVVPSENFMSTKMVMILLRNSF